MLGGLIAVALLSCACAYLVGYAFVAPRESFLRTREGGLVLGAAVLAALAMPSIMAQVVSTGAVGTWPTGLSPDAYRLLWIVLSAAGLLTGLRAWRMRFGSALSRAFTLDESPIGRVRGQLPFADSLEGALDVIARETLSQREIGSVADAIRAVGLRFWHRLPEKDGDVFELVRRLVPPAVAADVTRLLLEGAHRKQRA